VELVYRGKVREVYADGADLILVASDRVSVYDVILPTPIPDKGAILTQLSLWWFAQLGDLVPNHVLDEDVPAEWQGRAVRCRRLDMLPVECIARGYLAGTGLETYRATGSISGVELPPGLVEADRLPAPVFTPSTKAPQGEHDEYVTTADVANTVGAETAAELERLTLAVYGRGADIAPAGASSPTTSRWSGTGRRPLPTGTAPPPAPRCRPTSWPRPARAMWRSSSASPDSAGAPDLRRHRKIPGLRRRWTGRAAGAASPDPDH
jgi:phosphoribosylaminoimidazole-succinocarboxamide synthase